VWRYLDKRQHLEAAAKEIEAADKRAKVLGMRIAIRMNGTSDLPGDAIELAERFPRVQFYDYTKLPKPWERTRANYHLTASFDPKSNDWSACERAIAHGINVAVIVPERPALFRGWPTVDGDEHDLRFLDPVGHVVCLTPKGDARKAKVCHG
jgi:hypothetical protein